MSGSTTGTGPGVRRYGRRRGVGAGVLASLVVALVATVLPAPAGGHTPTDLLHGGSGRGVKVLGHSDLGGEGLNGHVAVLGDHAYVGYGTNGGYAGIWNKTPKCRDLANPSPTGTVKVVSLADPANPTVVSEIDVTAFRPNPEPHLTLARDVAALRVKSGPLRPSYDLLAVALEGCAATLGGDVGPTGVNFYDVTDPANPNFLSHDPREVPGVFGTRQVSLAQRPDGRVLAFEANIAGDPAGAIDVVDVTEPLAPVQVGRYDENNNDLGAGSCRPFSPAAGVSVNPDGTRAYAAYYDQGLIELDVGPAGNLTRTRKTTYAGYPASEEGNSFRFVPNGAGTRAVATDEDLLPARTTFTVASGPEAGDYPGCEAVWGGPLYRQATPALPDRPVVYVTGGCVDSDYVGKLSQGDIALVDRGGCGFSQKAKAAQDAGASAFVIATAGFLFSPDSAIPGDAEVDIPVVMVPNAAKQAVLEAGAGARASLTDSADSWGALRVFDLATSDPAAAQVATFHSPHSNVLTPGDGLYHAVNAVWDGDHAVVAWMSDGMRVVDLSNPAAPQAASFYVPPAAPDPTGNYASVPLVVDVEKYGHKVVISDVNGGLYVLAAAKDKDACKAGGWRSLGFTSQGECVNSFDV